MANFMTGQFGDPGTSLVNVRSNGGWPMTLHSAAAPNILGFVNQLEAAGAPISSLGSQNTRNIAGSDKLSQHAYGNAIDLSQKGRNEVSPAFKEWAAANPDALKAATDKWGMVNGGDWHNPDFGHFEWSGATPAPGTAAAAPPLPAPVNVGGAPSAAPDAAAAPADISKLLGSLGGGSGSGGFGDISKQLMTAAQKAPAGLPFPVQAQALSTAPLRPLPLNFRVGT